MFFALLNQPTFTICLEARRRIIPARLPTQHHAADALLRVWRAGGLARARVEGTLRTHARSGRSPAARSLVGCNRRLTRAASLRARQATVNTAVVARRTKAAASGSTSPWCVCDSCVHVAVGFRYPSTAADARLLRSPAAPAHRYGEDRPKARARRRASACACLHCLGPRSSVSPRRAASHAPPLTRRALASAAHSSWARTPATRPPT
jgi:hypothetical protein